MHVLLTDIHILSGPLTEICILRGPLSETGIKRPMRDACLHMGEILTEGFAGSAVSESLPTYSVFTSGWNFFKLGTYI